MIKAKQSFGTDMIKASLLEEAFSIISSIISSGSLGSGLYF